MTYHFKTFDFIGIDSCGHSSIGFHVSLLVIMSSLVMLVKMDKKFDEFLQIESLVFNEDLCVDAYNFLIGCHGRLQMFVLVVSNGLYIFYYI